MSCEIPLCHILSCPSIVNYEIAKYITELDHRILIQSSKILRNNFLIKEIPLMYRKKILSFIKHVSSPNYLCPVLSTLPTNEPNKFVKYSPRPKFYKRILDENYEV